MRGAAAEEVRAADCGVCVRAEDAAALAEAIRGLADRPEEFVRFGENARRYYQNTFTRDTFFKKLTRRLEETARNGMADAMEAADG